LFFQKCGKQVVYRAFAVLFSFTISSGAGDFKGESAFCGVFAIMNF